MSTHKHHRSAKNKNNYLARINKSAKRAIERLQKHLDRHPNDKNVQPKIEYVKTTGKTKGRHVHAVLNL